MSHYFNVLEGFNWQTRDGKIEDSEALIGILLNIKVNPILIVDDINDTGNTLNGISSDLKILIKIVQT